jgi:hypothetical protein
MHMLLPVALLALAAGTMPLAADEGAGGDEPSVTTRSPAAPPRGAPFLEPRGARAEPFALLGDSIAPGSSRQLSWAASELFDGLPDDTPVLVVHGAKPGPALCLTAAIHGDELNGIEIVRRVLHALEPDRLAGTVIGVPIVNIQAFRRSSRYLPDRRDLNRYFPGSPDGSAASRIAHSLFHDIILHCDALVDLHTGSFERTNLPQLRADLHHAGVAALANGFGATVIVNSQPQTGTLRQAATLAGVPAVTLEAGGPEQVEAHQVKHGVRGIEALLHTLGMTADSRAWDEREATYLNSSWVRADHGGILMSSVELGSTVREGQLLGRVTDPISNDSAGIYAPSDGRVIGMARNQVVMPGFAAYHLGSASRGRTGPLGPQLSPDEIKDKAE